MDYLEGKGGLETAVVDGVSVTAGFVSSGFLGNEVEKRVKVVTESSSWKDKGIAYVANNAPKVAELLVLDMLGSGHEIDVAKIGIVGNVITDTLVRASNKGVNNGKLFGYNILDRSVKTGASNTDVQRLIQENSGLRTELNKALQRLAAQPKGLTQGQAGQVQAAPVVYVQPVQQVPNPLQVPNVNPNVNVAQQAQMQAQARAQQTRMQEQARVQAQMQAQQRSQPVISVAPVIRTQEPPVIQERDRRFGFMGEEQDRQRKYGAMPTYDAPAPVKGRERKYGFMEHEQEIASAFGML